MDTGRVVLVTGAAGRIGSTIVEAFARLGDQVIATDLQHEQLQARWAQRTEFAHPIILLSADITDETAVEQVVETVVRQVGPPAILVNCAGIFPNTPVVEMPTAEWDQVFAINLRAPFIFCRAVARQMLAHQVPGVIVNISSGAGSSARTGGSHYCGSKAALEMLTQVLAIELGTHHIRVNAVAPGLILDEVIEQPVPADTNPYVTTLLHGIPLGRTGRPEEISDAVVFLCSPQASWITGTILGVNGGSQAGRTHLPPSNSAR